MQAALTAWSPELAQDLLDADDARYAAMMANDTRVLERFLSDHLAYTHSDGQTDTKSEYLAQIAEGKLRYRRRVRESLSSLPLGEEALVKGVLRLEALFKGREARIRIHYLAAWARSEGNWQLVAWASTRLPEVSQ